MSEFVTDVHALRAAARQEMLKGPVTAAYRADLPRVLVLLNAALATETVCVLRYRQHHFAATGLNAEPVAEEFLRHSEEEQHHADLLAARIAQLGGTPDLDPMRVAERAHTTYVASTDLREMIEENLVAERVAIAGYTEMISWLGDGDPTTRRVLEEILASEEEHAEDMLGFLGGGH
ncbi:ferritin-like domain-containing protein [Kitasatospora sp. NBC_01287]|uniref:ferritin-like domain-containing protein n=1 Tax=Kitasatospora sp. NBC_01287 TaxID=2903573 RepID=UPI0022571FD4|nr:ferritin-like domain-containing protein [Kitasatospora sp. NBC_01287]MCX4744216.1 ferritin-like domain-containing protein [Kitasatospora sp. NBC_01287]